MSKRLFCQLTAIRPSDQIRVMGIVGLTFLVLAFGGVTPGYAGECGMGNQCPIADTLTTNPGLFFISQTGQVQATAHDPDGSLTRYEFTADAGLFGNGATTEIVETAQNSVSVYWTAPAVTGSYNLSVRVWDNGGIMGIPTSGSVSARSIIVVVSDSNHAPIIESISAASLTIAPGGLTDLSAIAIDSDGDAITYSWQAITGLVVAGEPGYAVYQAPATRGTDTVSCTVQDEHGAHSTLAITLSVSAARPVGMITQQMVTPQRVAADTYGYLFIADRYAGGVLVFNAATGELTRQFNMPEITSVAIDWDGNMVIGKVGSAFVMDRGGDVIKALGAAGSFCQVSDVAVDQTLRRYLVLDGAAVNISVLDEFGEFLFSFGTRGEAPGELMSASAIAVKESGEILIADAGRGVIQIYSSAGVYLQTVGSSGSNAGQFNQLHGVTSNSSGDIYASDAYQCRINVFSAGGVFLETIGGYGYGMGSFRTPTGVTVDAFNRLLVLSSNTSSLHLFELGDEGLIPSNSPPLTPTALDGPAVAILGSSAPFELAVVNARDYDFQPLSYVFELYRTIGGNDQLVASQTEAETPLTTAVDVRSDLTVAGHYLWRARAWDGIAYSDWTSIHAFEVMRPAIGDRVWLDLNADGIQDEVEPGFSGITVELLESNGSVRASTVTDLGGGFHFPDLDFGLTAAIRFVLPAMHLFTLANAGSDDLHDSDADQTTGETATFSLVDITDLTRWDAGIMPICGSPRSELDIFSVSLNPDGNGFVVLSFSDTNNPGLVTGYNIFRSNDPSLPIAGWSMLALNAQDIDPGLSGIQWQDTDGTPQTAGEVWFYQVTPFNNQCPL